MPKHLRILTVMLSALALSGCLSAHQHARDVEAANAEAQNLSVGTVQREIRLGMSGADVAQVLGSPNIVTTDEGRREVWVYDRISTTRAYSTNSGGISTLVLGGRFISKGALTGRSESTYDYSSGADATTQKTLTVIIKFNDEGRVRDFAYHTSRF